MTRGTLVRREVTTSAAASASESAASRPATRGQRPRVAGIPLADAAALAPPARDPTGAADSAALKAPAVANRSAGSFSSAVSTASSTCGGTRSLRAASGAGRSVITFATMAWAVGPVNGGSPASISYSTQPSA